MMRFFWWKFVHNFLVHGLLMSWPYEPEWVDRLHRETGYRYSSALEALIGEKQ